MQCQMNILLSKDIQNMYMIKNIHFVTQYVTLIDLAPTEE